MNDILKIQNLMISNRHHQIIQIWVKIYPLAERYKRFLIFVEFER